MPIPIIQVPDLAASGQIGVPPSLAAMNAPWQGLQKTAQGIAQVNDAFAQHAGQVQQLENTYQESEARQAIASRISDFSTSLDTNTDPSTYLDSLEKVLTETKSLTTGKTLSPIVSQKLALWHSDLSAQTRIRTAERAAGMTTKRASLAIENELKAAATYNNEAAYTDALTRGIDGGIILPEQRDSLMTRFQQDSTYNKIISAIDDDPIGIAEDLEAEDITRRYPHLTPENHERITRYAQQKKNQRVAETWTEIQKASIEGNILSKDDVLGMMRQGDLTPEQAGSYLRAYHSGAATTFEPLVFDNARSMVHAYDPAKDPTGAVRATIAANLATTPLPKEFIKELQSQFDAKLKKPDAPKHRLATEYATRIDTEWKAESFGDWFDMEKDSVEGRISRKIIREKDFDAALSYKSKVQSQFDAWLMSQPDDLDPIQAGKKYSEIKTGVLQGQPPVELPPPTMFAPPSFPDPTAADDTTKTSSYQFPKPIKLSNYGYPSDTTPDSFSAKGIGHSNNQLIDGVSAAITKSLATELGLKSGDWFVAQTTEGPFRLRYDDTVPETDKRTGPLPPTIDIYRKTRGSNSWGGKVLALQKIDAPQKVSDIGAERSRLFRDIRPTTADSATALIEQIYNLANLDTLDS
jgi:hypothetical protein